MKFKVDDKIRIKHSVILSCDSKIQDNIKGIGKLIRQMSSIPYWLVRFNNNNCNYYFKDSSLERTKNQQLLFSFME